MKHYNENYLRTMTHKQDSLTNQELWCTLFCLSSCICCHCKNTSSVKHGHENCSLLLLWIINPSKAWHM